MNNYKNNINNTSHCMFVDEQLKKYPGARRDVLEFIWRVVNHNPIPEGQEAIENIFASGYCYYFALMLKDAFGGDIRWPKYKGHIVWVDVINMIAYDIHGVYEDAGPDELLPLELLGDTLEGFRHRGRDEDTSIANHTRESIDMVEKYTKTMSDAYKSIETSWGKDRNALLLKQVEHNLKKIENTNDETSLF